MIGELAIALMGVIGAMYLAEYVVTPAIVGPFWGDFQSVMVPIVLMYLPIVLASIKRRPADYVERGMGVIGRGILFGGLASLLVLPLFALAAAGVLSTLIPVDLSRAVFPSFGFIITELVLVALPEEYFFRGYVQSRLRSHFPPRWRVLGVSLGHGWWITAMLFALAHSAVSPHVWHLLIFFPALLFGYLRERTGGIAAPIVFHAASNVIMQWVMSAT